MALRAMNVKPGVKYLTKPAGINGMISFVDLESPCSSPPFARAARIDAESAGT